MGKMKIKKQLKQLYCVAMDTSTSLIGKGMLLKLMEMNKFYFNMTNFLKILYMNTNDVLTILNLNNNYKVNKFKNNWNIFSK